MRSIGRVFVSSSDVGVRAQIRLAEAAEAAGLEGVWVHGPGTAHGDSYATTAAAAVASATRHLRIGVVLYLTAGEDVLRLAEDIAVLDQCSSGRAELCFRGRRPGDPTWHTDADRLLTNLRSCEVGQRSIAVTPGPLQPAIPSVMWSTESVRFGTVVEIGTDRSTDRAGARVVLRADAEQTLAVLSAAADAEVEADADALATAVDRLRTAVAEHDAQDLVFDLPSADCADCAESVDTLATVIAPLLRANDDELPDMVLDTLKFRRARTRFPAAR